MNTLKTISIFTFAVLCSGCAADSPKDNPASGRVDAPPSIKEEITNEFLIGTTKFGIETKTIRFEVTKDPDQQSLLTVEIRGNEETARKLMSDEKSGWSWISGSPYFYLRKYPVQWKEQSKELKFKLKPEDSEKFDVALYLAEHNHVKNVDVTIVDERIEITGQVDMELVGKPWTSFRIKWDGKR